MIVEDLIHSCWCVITMTHTQKHPAVAITVESSVVVPKSPGLSPLE
jgi:hypothetical protein